MHDENMAKNLPKCCKITKIFSCDNLWKSISINYFVENSGTSFSYFVATL